MRLRLVLYVSESTTPMSRSDLLALNYVSQQNNLQAGLTGLMLYSSGNFMQAIEGPANRVWDVLDRIHRDVRHLNMRTLLDEITGERFFEQWAMGLIEVDRLQSLDLERLSMVMRAANQSSSPEEAHRHGRVALELLKDFRRQTSVMSA